MLKKLISYLVGGLLASAILVSLPSVALADGGTECWRGNCVVAPPPVPGSPGGGGGGTSDPVTGFTPGPTDCYRLGEPADKENKIPCTNDKGGAYQPALGCYMQLADPQKAAPSGAGEGEGAWYYCIPPTCKPSTGMFDTPCISSSAARWLTSPPPGIAMLTPAQAAKSLVATFQLEGVTVGSTTKASGKGAVGLPVWLWVENPTPLSWGPYEKSATLGGVTVTAKARVANVAYSMGDGETVVCANPGTPYVKGYGNTDSPTCGHRYGQMSPGDGAQPYTVTATSNWEVSWTSTGGETGVIGTTTQSQLQIRVGELQAVNVNP